MMVETIKFLLAVQASLREAGIYVNTATATEVARLLKESGIVLDNQVSSSKWIPVSERLPEDHTERVIVKIKDANNIIGHPDMDTDRYLEDMWVRWGHNVTHWMPLPEPPREDQQ